MRRGRLWVAALGLTLLPVIAPAYTFRANEGVLPPGSTMGEPSTRPRQVLTVDRQGGRVPYLVALGKVAFNAPEIFGGLARQARMTCNACHRNGANNPELFVDGLSTRPGTFDPTNALFNPKTDDGIFQSVDIPSLRGIRLTGPYGRDGRFASLREFTRHVIVEEFAGAEPSPLILDALVAYQQQFEFLPNAIFRPDGRLIDMAPAAARRGEVLFFRPFPSAPELSCAGCHPPTANFLDRRQHDFGGGTFDTPSLRDVRFSAPFFHDGRFPVLAQVVDYFNDLFGLGLSSGDRSDLVAYLDAVGDGERPEEAITLATDLADLSAMIEALDGALADEDRASVALVVDTARLVLSAMHDRYPEREAAARQVLVEWSVQLRQIDRLSGEDEFEEAKLAFRQHRNRLSADEAILRQAQTAAGYIQ